MTPYDLTTMLCEGEAPEFVAIIGSRGYPVLREVEQFVRALSAKYPLVKIVSGGAPGVDITAEEEARDCGLIVRSYRPKKRTTGRSTHYEVLVHETSRFVLPMRDDDGHPLRFHNFPEAAFTRNGWIVEDGTIVVAFWDGRSTGTADSMEKALRTGKPLWRKRPGEPFVLVDSIAA